MEEQILVVDQRGHTLAQLGTVHKPVEFKGWYFADIAADNFGKEVRFLMAEYLDAADNQVLGEFAKFAEKMRQSQIFISRGCSKLQLSEFYRDDEGHFWFKYADDGKGKKKD